MVDKDTQKACRAIHRIADNNDLFIFAVIYDGHDTVEINHMHESEVMDYQEHDNGRLGVHLYLPNTLDEDSSYVMADFAYFITKIRSILKGRLQMYESILRAIGKTYKVKVEDILDSAEDNENVLDEHATVQ